MKILNFGSLNIDSVYQVEHFVQPGETISSSSLEKYGGGKGLNQTIALARAGAEVFHAGAVGEADGLFLKDLLKENGVHTEFVVEKKDCPTGHAIIQVNQTGQNSIILYGGTNQAITEESVEYTLAHFDRGDFLILQNEINQMEKIMEIAYKKGMRIVLNPSPMNDKIKALPLDYVEYFILNEVEAAGLTQIDGKDALQVLSEKFPGAKIVLTLGEDGVQYLDDREQISHGIYKVNAVDTTAAGDTFTGYFFGSLARGCGAEEALQLASKASALAVSKHGAEPSIPHLKDVLDSQLDLK